MPPSVPHARSPRAFPAPHTVDGSGKVVMPGFANIHTHFTLIIAKGIYEDLSPPHKPPFTSGLAPLPVPELSRDEMIAMVRLAALEAIRSGTTAALEDGSNVENYAQSIADTGLRLLLCEKAWDKAKGNIGDPGPFDVDAALGDECIARTEALHAKWHGACNGRITVGVSAWAPDMCSPDLLRKLRALQEKLDTVATIHLNQVWGEVSAVEKIRNRKPTEYLADIGFLNDRLICAHCRCMVREEERLLGEARTNVAFNACIAARRGLSPRVHDLQEFGCNIGMGTDNMAEDMVEVMRTGMFMERVRREDGRQPDARTGDALGDGERLSRDGNSGWGLAGARQEGRSDHDRLPPRPSRAAAARGLDLRAPGTGARRDRRHGRRRVADARGQGADDGRGRNGRGGATGLGDRLGAAVREAPGSEADRRLATDACGGRLMAWSLLTVSRVARRMCRGRARWGEKP